MTTQNATDLIDRIVKVYDYCTPEEQIVLYTIMQELSEYGYSQTYEDVWLADYKEIPVDKKTFLTDPYYLGNSNNNGASNNMPPFTGVSFTNIEIPDFLKK